MIKEKKNKLGEKLKIRYRKLLFSYYYYYYYYYSQWLNGTSPQFSVVGTAISHQSQETHELSMNPSV